MNKLLSWLLASLEGQAKFVVAAYGLIVFVYNYVVGTIEKIEATIAQADAVVRPAFESMSMNISPLSLMNYVLPLDLAMTLFASWLVFYLACTGIRMIKAWIPTVS